MNTNVEFKSNVYPITSSVSEDRIYLSKIYDYVRLKNINKRYFSVGYYSVWNQTQKRIIDEIPTCTNCNPDPCWGAPRNPADGHWGCRCVKTDCTSFSTCRPDFDEKELVLFSPLLNTLSGYHYEYEDIAPIYYPVLYSDENCAYESNITVNTMELNNFEHSKDICQASIEIVEVLQWISEEIKVASTAKKEEISDSVIMHNASGVENPTIEETADEADIKAVSETSINIFDYFEDSTQEAIINSPYGECLFVDAGPGTGKTHTLIQKINYMVTHSGVNPEGILVLCFTNAAVDEIRSRFKEFISAGADRGLANVDIRTFHSFAWWLICQSNELFSDIGWTVKSMNELTFDTSIQIASRAMSQFNEQIVEHWEHFIVDEVQDLTNELGRFVLKIVNCCMRNKCGVTVFGDSCQAIYDYTKDNATNPLTSEMFYNTLFKNMSGKAKFLKLAENKRQSPSLIELNTDLRTAILSKESLKMKQAAETIMQKIEVLCKTSANITTEDLETLRNGGKVCILHRNNGQTLRMSSNFRKRGIAHQLNVSETNRNYSPWIADVFASYNKPEIAFDVFEDKLASIDPMLTISAQTTWERMQKLLHDNDDVLNVKNILDGIGHSKIDDSIFRVTNNENVIVSNIHRAKGREYECVILDRSYGLGLSAKEGSPDEYKTMYVALTRPKSKLVTFEDQLNGNLYLIEIYATKRKRWGQIKGKKMTYLEFLSNIDLDINSFAFVDQSFLSQIRVGDSLTIQRIIENNEVKYDIIHDDTDAKLVRISETYAEDIKNRMGITKAIEMPSTISNIYVSGVYSQIVDKDFLNINPEIKKMAPNGVWKWIDIAGAGHMSYDA